MKFYRLQKIENLIKNKFVNNNLSWIKNEITTSRLSNWL